jgi:hypothetical protein
LKEYARDAGEVFRLSRIFNDGGPERMNNSMGSCYGVPEKRKPFEGLKQE